MSLSPCEKTKNCAVKGQVKWQEKYGREEQEERAGRPAAPVSSAQEQANTWPRRGAPQQDKEDFVSGGVGGMAPPAAQAQLLLSSHPSPSPPHHRRLLPLLLRRQPPRPHTCTIRHYQGHDKCASSSPRLRHALRPPAAAAAVAIAPGDHWGNWAFLLSAAAFGTW